MDLAVAFVGQDWRNAIADFRGRLRVVCWLSSTNTNPRAVRQMRSSHNVWVRQRNSMHAKVYLAPDIGAVVASSNLSSQALATVEASGRDEAGVLLSDRRSVEEVSRWFRDIWNGSSRITGPDIANAIRAYDKARAAERKRVRRRGGHLPGLPDDDPLPRTGTADLQRLARVVRHLDLTDEIVEHRLLKGLDPRRISRRQVEAIAKALALWLRRRFLVDRGLLRRPLPRVRKALTTLLNGVPGDVDARLSRVINSGALDPFRVSTLSLLLHWRTPDTYVPYNWRTGRFLKDFRLGKRGASGSSPAAYRRWLEQATVLSQRLELPTPGHLDRVVWEYTHRLKR